MLTTVWVKESRFGIWFLNTRTWQQRVLEIAILDLKRLLPYIPDHPTILDIGCGRGHSFSLLETHFKPAQIVAIEIDSMLMADAMIASQQCGSHVSICSGNAERLPYANRTFDVLFCHQSFHHIVQHQKAMQEFYRVLKPGGLLLFAESCKRFIHSLPIRLLFRHPMDVQKTAEEYLALIRQSGFQVDEQQISIPYLWWSRPDIGALEWFGFSPKTQYEPTLLNLVAVKK